MAHSVFMGRAILCLVILNVSILTSCKSTGAVCPGSGQSKAADFSPFNSDGKPKERKKKKPDNGLQDKKQPSRLNKR